MDDDPAHTLLRDALALLNDRPNFSLRHDPKATSYRLAGRIDAYFTSLQPAKGRRCRRATTLPDRAILRFDAPPAQEAREWAPAWVHVLATGTYAALDAATAALPPMTREAFLAHRDRDLDYPTIAAELGIGVAEVATHIATALVRLDEAMTALRGGDASEGGRDDDAR